MAYNVNGTGRITFPLDGSYFFKFIMSGNEGLLEVTLLYQNRVGVSEKENKVFFRNRDTGEEFINFNQDPNINAILL